MSVLPGEAFDFAGLVLQGAIVNVSSHAGVESQERLAMM